MNQNNKYFFLIIFIIIINSCITNSSLSVMDKEEHFELSKELFSSYLWNFDTKMIEKSITMELYNPRIISILIFTDTSFYSGKIKVNNDIIELTSSNYNEYLSKINLKKYSKLEGFLSREFQGVNNNFGKIIIIYQNL